MLEHQIRERRFGPVLAAGVIGRFRDRVRPIVQDRFDESGR
jgi:hypothetical protein